LSSTFSQLIPFNPCLAVFSRPLPLRDFMCPFPFNVVQKALGTNNRWDPLIAWVNQRGRSSDRSRGMRITVEMSGKQEGKSEAVFYLFTTGHVSPLAPWL
jgi:hypothetical protein